MHYQCKKMERLISAYVHQECSPTEEEKVKEHLKCCPSCEKIFQEYQALAKATRNIKLPLLTDEVLNAFYFEMLRKKEQFGKRIRPREIRFIFKPARVFVVLGLVLAGLGTWHYFLKPVPEFVLQENMTLTEVLTLERQFRDARIRKAWMDQPIPVSHLIGLLIEMQRFQRLHGSVTPRLEETLERIVAETNPVVSEPISSFTSMDVFSLDQSIEYLKRIRRYQSEITLRELAALYAQVRKI